MFTYSYLYIMYNQKNKRESHKFAFDYYSYNLIPKK